MRRIDQIFFSLSLSFSLIQGGEEQIDRYELK